MKSLLGAEVVFDVEELLLKLRTIVKNMYRCLRMKMKRNEKYPKLVLLE